MVFWIYLIDQFFVLAYRPFAKIYFDTLDLIVKKVVNISMTTLLYVRNWRIRLFDVERILLKGKLRLTLPFSFASDFNMNVDDYTMAFFNYSGSFCKAINISYVFGWFTFIFFIPVTLMFYAYLARFLYKEDHYVALFVVYFATVWLALVHLYACHHASLLLSKMLIGVYDIPLTFTILKMAFLFLSLISLLYVVLFIILLFWFLVRKLVSVSENGHGWWW